MQISRSQAPEFIPKWAVQLAAKFPLSDDVCGERIGAMVDKVGEASGFPREYAVLVCLASVSAAAGRAWSLRTPSGDIDPLFHVLGASGGAMGERMLLGLPFAPLHRQVDVDFRSRPGNHNELLSSAQKLVGQRREIAAAMKKVESELLEIPGFQMAFVEQLAARAASMAERERNDKGFRRAELCAKLLDLKAQEKETKKAIADTARQSAPAVVAEGLFPDQLARARSIALGGVLCNLDVYGRTVGAWARAGKESRRHIFSLLMASFDGGPFIDGLEMREAPSVGHVGLVDSEQIAGMVRDKDGLGRELLHRSVVLDLASAERGRVNLSAATVPCPLVRGLPHRSVCGPESRGEIGLQPVDRGDEAA